MRTGDENVYKEEKRTDRIEKIREIYRKCPVATQTRRFFYSGDRWLSLGYLEGWLEHETSLTTKVRRSMAEARELDEAKPIIHDFELLAGELYFPEYTPEEQQRFDTLAEAFHMSSACETKRSRVRADHICLDFEKLLRVGIYGLIKEIKEKKEALDVSCMENLHDFRTVEKNEF